MLHEGLGSITQWREVPALIAERTGAGVVAYDRAGHGVSTPIGSRGADWLHVEADVLARLLERLEISEPILVGHSDGGSIALIHAASGARCRAVVTLAAHSWVEPCCVEAIASLRADPADIIEGLSRAHAAPAELFDAWSRVWTSEEFQTWDIRPSLGAISCPTVVVQGATDEYATDAQLTETVAAIGRTATLVQMPEVGHMIHREIPEIVVDLVADLHDQLRRSG